jgi:hypothetical protein
MIVDTQELIEIRNSLPFNAIKGKAILDGMIKSSAADDEQVQKWMDEETEKLEF